MHTKDGLKPSAVNFLNRIALNLIIKYLLISDTWNTWRRSTWRRTRWETGCASWRRTRTPTSCATSRSPTRRARKATNKKCAEPTHHISPQNFNTFSAKSSYYISRKIFVEHFCYSFYNFLRAFQANFGLLKWIFKFVCFIWLKRSIVSILF